MYINEIANKDKAIEQGYFWAVTEAKISKEGSMVLFGSNDVTQIIENKTEAEKITSEIKEEPTQVTQKRKISVII